MLAWLTHCKFAASRRSRRICQHVKYSLSFYDIKKSKLRIAFFILLVLVFGCKPKLIQNSELENKIFSSLELDKNTFNVGDLVLVNFRILNKSDQEIFINNSTIEARGNGKRVGGIDVTVQNEIGETIKTGSGVSVGKGRTGIIKVKPFETCDFRFYLSEHVSIQKAGNYKLFVSKKISVFLDERKNKNRKYESRNYKKYFTTTMKSSLPFQVVEN